ncbi:MAG: hypothetical protein ACE37F_11210 [Nannocystaceae bacterium]|nr:hypothetical protein [bacterium]
MLKKLAIALGVVLLVGAVVLVVLYRQVTALPEWADDEVAEQEAMDPDAPVVWEAEGEDVGPLPPEVAEALPADPTPARPNPGADGPAAMPAPTKRKSAKRYVLKGFHRRGKGAGKKAVRASKAVLEGGRLSAGVVLDLSRIEDAKMSQSDRGLYEGALQAFPPLRKKNVYVGVETRPVRKDGVLQLGPKAKLRVGNVRYDLGAAARKLGMSEAGLRRALNKNLRTLGFESPR